MTYPLFAARQHSVSVMRGVMAHEHQHLKQRDVTGLRWCLTLARLLTTTVVVMVGATVLPGVVLAALLPIVGKGWSAAAAARAYLAVTAFVVFRTMGWWFPLTPHEAKAGAAM